MPDGPAQVEIPRRALYKAAEVCDLAKVQPYVLRSWEAEFPRLGVTTSAGAPRTYRPEDGGQVLRVKHLLLVEGLTLAGARARLEEETAPVAANAPAIDELIGRNARERLTEVKRGLRSILSLLSRHSEPGELRLTSPVAAPARARSMPVKSARGKAPASRNGSARSARR